MADSSDDGLPRQPRAGIDRRLGAERRVREVPVEFERRSGLDRRSGVERRLSRTVRVGSVTLR